MSDPRVLALRVQLYAAVQTLEGRDAMDFWMLLEEVRSLRPKVPGRRPGQ